MDLRSAGILNVRAGRQWWHNAIHPPVPELAELVEHYWEVQWDLRGHEPYTQHTLSNASVHFVIERGRSRIQGVTTGRFTRVLEDKGRVFGIKFRPAGFRPFLKSSVSALTDRVLPVREVFGSDGDALAEEVASLEDPPRRLELSDAFLRGRLPAPDPTVHTINRIVELIVNSRSITKVGDVEELVGMGKRTLQRLFHEYVGVSPKWVIQRYRLHDAAGRLAAGENLDLAALALDLGYFDQPHFVRAFKAIVGKAPAEYARSAK